MKTVEYVIWERTPAGKILLGEGETLEEAKRDWFDRLQFRDPLPGTLQDAISESGQYDAIKLYGPVMWGKLAEPRGSYDPKKNPPPNEEHNICPRFLLAINDARIRQTVKESRAARWVLFSETWYGKLLISCGLA